MKEDEPYIKVLCKFPSITETFVIIKTDGHST